MENETNALHESSSEEKTTPSAEAQQEKLFTQAEVNAIVKDRLDRYKAKNKAEKDDQAATLQQTLQEKEKELSEREKVLSCREYLRDKEYPAELISIISADNLEEFKKKADKAVQLLTRKEPSFMPSPEFKTSEASAGSGRFTEKSFKHVPKKYY